MLVRYVLFINSALKNSFQLHTSSGHSVSNIFIYNNIITLYERAIDDVYLINV